MVLGVVGRLHVGAEAHRAAAGLELSADDLEERRLPGPVHADDPDAVAAVRLLLGVTLVVHLLLTLIEHRAAPSTRAGEYARAAALIHRGPFARRQRWLGVGLGTLAPIAALALPLPSLWPAAAALALVGLYFTQDTLVRAGQAPAIS